MAFSELQSDRFRLALGCLTGIATKNMMGGRVFMLNGNMVGGVDKEGSGTDRFMFRVGPDNMTEALSRPGCTQVKMGGRPMKGFVFVADCGDDTLKTWLDLALSYVQTLPAK